MKKLLMLLAVFGFVGAYAMNNSQWQRVQDAPEGLAVLISGAGISSLDNSEGGTALKTTIFTTLSTIEVSPDGKSARIDMKPLKDWGLLYAQPADITKLKKKELSKKTVNQDVLKGAAGGAAATVGAYATVLGIKFLLHKWGKI